MCKAAAPEKPASPRTSARKTSPMRRIAGASWASPTAALIATWVFLCLLLFSTHTELLWVPGFAAGLVGLGLALRAALKDLEDAASPVVVLLGGVAYGAVAALRLVFGVRTGGRRPELLLDCASVAYLAVDLWQRHATPPRLEGPGEAAGYSFVVTEQGLGLALLLLQAGAPDTLAGTRSALMAAVLLGMLQARALGQIAKLHGRKEATVPSKATRQSRESREDSRETPASREDPDGGAAISLYAAAFPPGASTGIVLAQVVLGLVPAALAVGEAWTQLRIADPVVRWDAMDAAGIYDAVQPRVRSAVALVIALTRLMLHLTYTVGITGEPEPSLTPEQDSAAQAPPPVPERLWRVHGGLYDLQSFARSHPGGVAAVLLGKGRDCTALFESYHPFTERHAQVLRKYAVPKPGKAVSVDMPVPVAALPRDEVYEEMCLKARQSVEARGLSAEALYSAPPTRSLYYVAVLSLAAVAYGLYLRLHWLGLVAFPVLSWLMGACGHDGAHFAASRQPWLNRVYGHVGMFFLSNPLMWYHQHTFAHHSHTNAVADDPDLHHFSAYLRVHRRFPWRSAYGPQAALACVLPYYALVTLGTCIFIPLKLAVFGHIQGVVKLRNFGFQQRFEVLSHVSLYLGLVLLAPLALHGNRSAVWLAALWQMAASGIFFGLFSQVNHLVAEAIHAGERGEPRLQRSWAATQVETSNNFCCGSPFWTTLSNGLNFQIEHHLFPGVNHAWLPMLKPAVEEVCATRGIQYREYHTYNALLGALGDHLRSLAVPEM